MKCPFCGAAELIQDKAECVEDWTRDISWLTTSLIIQGTVMREVGAFEAKNKLSMLLDCVEHGEEILITRHGKPVARLVPSEPSFDRAKAQQAARGLLEASRGVTLGGLSIKELVNMGRP